MSDMLVTFQDDSQAIAHYGVIGMHWGEWNEETAAKYGARGKKAVKLTQSASKNAEKALAKKAKGDEKGYNRQMDKMAGKMVKAKVAETKHHAQVDKAIAKLDNRSRKALETGKTQTYLHRQAAANYLRKSNDRSVQNYDAYLNKALTIGVWTGGAVGGGVATALALSTPRGKQINENYLNRINEVMNRSMLRVGSEKQVGKDKVDAMLKKSFAKSGRHDIY